MAFLLFLLVNAALFVRPAEIVPALLGWEIYFYLILACLLLAVPDVVRCVLGQSPTSQPIALCVFGLAVIIPLPYLFTGDLAEAWRTGFYFAKVVIYFVLFVSLVTTPERLRAFLACLLIFAGAITLVAVLRYHDVIYLDTIEALKDRVEGSYGTSVEILRLQGTGIFSDPNELCVLLSALVPVCLYFLFTDRNLLLRGLGLGLMPLFAYAVSLTQSRGGFLAFAGGLGALVWMRFGWKKASLIGVVGVPILLILFSGRQTEITTNAGTAQSRLALWRDWLMTFRDNMLLGNGISLGKEEEVKNRRSDEAKRHLAHNSYLQGFADLGFVGGCLLVGAFFTALLSMYRLNSRDSLLVDADLCNMQPYVFGAVASYALGMMSLSLCYIVPTYMMLGVAIVYTQMAYRSAAVMPAPVRLDARLVAYVVGAGCCVLVSIYMLSRFFA